MYVLRKTRIFLTCDKSVSITNPDFTYDKEKDFEYVSVYTVYMIVNASVKNTTCMTYEENMQQSCWADSFKICLDLGICLK